MRIYSLLLLTVLLAACEVRDEKEYLANEDVINNLALMDDILQSQSSYQGLNGYDYREDFARYSEGLASAPVTEYEFGLFLAKTIGKIGDRHAFIKDYQPRDSLYFPLAFAPYEDRVLVLDYQKEDRMYSFWDADFPYLKSMNNIPIETILSQLLPGDIHAPKDAYTLQAVRDLRDVQTVFRLLGEELTNPVSLTLANEAGAEKEVNIQIVPRKGRARLWDERFYRDIFIIQDDQYNDPEFIERFFAIDNNNIGYIQLPDMISKEDCPVFVERLNTFMAEAKDSEALIIDVRDNGGGTRDLIQELAGYFVHPDSIYVVNAVRQRAKTGMTEDLKGELHGRYLFARSELDEAEQSAVDQFSSSFTPMYDLDDEKFSEFYFYVFNGQKLSPGKFHYDKPIYILANERTFSAASILTSVFKGLPNITIAGVNTDGSSGNSERFELPHTDIRGKISTMVSFQKDGTVLDGIGTPPDIPLQRNLDQILWKEDYQLNALKNMITGD